MFELCLRLGAGRWVHPDEMLAEMSASELSDWWDYHRAEPWGESRADARASWQVMLIGSLLGNKPLESACAAPGYINEIYGPPELDEETKATLRRIRNVNSRNH